MIDFEIQGAVVVITLRNGRLNILTRAMHRQLYGSFLRFLRDDTLKVAVLTCAAGSSFSAGDDLNEVELDFGEEPDWEELLMQLPRTKPVIGAVRGHCVAQGLVYLLALTDIRFATPDARFGFPEIRHGMSGAVALTRLAQQIPQVVAMRMALTGESINAPMAARIYMVNDLVADDALLATAVAEAEEIAQFPLAALRGEMVANARNSGLSQAEAMTLFSQVWDVRGKS